MIATVTLNAAIDKTYYLDDLALGRVNRVRTMHAVPGGKGINVARVASLLGEDVTATGIVCGSSGEFILRELSRSGIPADFVQGEAGESRVCLNIVSESAGQSTEILEAGSPVGEETVQRIRDKVSELARRAQVVVLSGSLPPGMPAGIYADLIGLIKARGAFPILDTSGEALALGVKAAPGMIKPNEDELLTLAGGEPRGEAELAAVAARMMDSGIDWVAVTLGAGGSLAGFRGALYRVRAPQVEAVNPVGCGDAFVAGMAAAIRRGLGAEDSLRLATAAATANALTKQAGLIVPEDVERLLGEVSVDVL